MYIIICTDIYTPGVSEAAPSFHLHLDSDDADWSDPAHKLAHREHLGVFYGSKLAISRKMPCDIGSEVKSFIPSKTKKPVVVDKEVTETLYCDWAPYYGESFGLYAVFPQINTGSK